MPWRVSARPAGVGDPRQQFGLVADDQRSECGGKARDPGQHEQGKRMLGTDECRGPWQVMVREEVLDVLLEHESGGDNRQQAHPEPRVSRDVSTAGGAHVGQAAGRIGQVQEASQDGERKDEAGGAQQQACDRPVAVAGVAQLLCEALPGAELDEVDRVVTDQQTCRGQQAETPGAQRGGRHGTENSRTSLLVMYARGYAAVSTDPAGRRMGAA